MKLLKEKTWKREIAFLVFLWMIYLSLYSIEALKLVVVPAFTFMGLAFGMEWYDKSPVMSGKTSMKDAIEGEYIAEDKPDKDLRGGA